MEPDGRVWLAAPSNGFGGAVVLPKGRVDPGATFAASALREAWEETGLRARLTGFLGDFDRSVTRTRIFIGERIGGHPGAMGWETQASILAPAARLPELLTGLHDGPLVVALLSYLGALSK